MEKIITFCFKWIIVFYLVWYLPFSLLALRDEAPFYACSFETNLEQEDWCFLSGSEFPNGWMVGSYFSSDGHNSLYVSSFDCTHGVYAEQRGSCVAYRYLTLPESQLFRVSFDWYSEAPASDVMCVCWVDHDFENVDAWATNNHAIPSGVKIYGRVSHHGVLKSDGTSNWHHSSFVVRGSGVASRLLFYWTNNKVISGSRGGCIDNIRVERVEDGEELFSSSVGCVADCQVPVSLVDSSVDRFLSDVSVFPQRVSVSGRITLYYEGVAEVTLLSEVGRLVRHAVQLKGGSEMEVPNMPGLYLLQIRLGNQVRIFKLLVTWM